MGFRARTSLVIGFALIAWSLSCSAQWWDAGWLYRQEYSVTENTGSPLSDYQVNFSLDTASLIAAGRMQADCADLRLTNDSGTLLDYTVTSGCDSASTNVWVRYPALSGTKDFYLYYGNASAAASADSDAVFLFYDDFSGDLSKWDNRDQPDIVIESGYLLIANGSTSGDYGHAVLGTNETYDSFVNGTVEFDIYPAVDAICEISFRGLPVTNGGYKVRYDARTGTESPWYTNPYEGWSAFGSSITRFTQAGQWAHAHFSVNGSRFRMYYEGDLKSTEDDSSETAPGELSLQNHYGDYCRYDNFLVRKYADTEPTVSFAGNAAPSIGPVIVDDADSSPANEVDLVAGGARVVNCTAVVTDDNGFSDVAVDGSVVAEFYETVQGLDDYSGNNDDENYRYTNTSCAFSGGSGTDVTATCSFTVQYYANPGGWTCSLNATDGSDATVAATDTTTVNTLVALSVPATLDFGELALGATSDDTTLTVTNTGNEQIDVSLDGYGAGDGDGYAMACSTGAVDLVNLRYDLSSGTDYGSMTSLTDSATTLASFDLAARTDAESMKTIYWKFQLPATGLAGACTGVINVNAQSG